LYKPHITSLEPAHLQTRLICLLMGHYFPTSHPGSTQ